jgi:hypothetical protein
MDEKPKIQFADKPANPAIGWIAGLPLTVSPGAADLLAGIHLVVQLMQQFTGMTPTMPATQALMPPEPETKEDGNTLDLSHLYSLSPLARAEVLAMHGLAMAKPDREEADPTAVHVANILEEAAKD